jgi:hypothetical protein
MCPLIFLTGAVLFVGLLVECELRSGKSVENPGRKPLKRTINNLYYLRRIVREKFSKEINKFRLAKEISSL